MLDPKIPSFGIDPNDPLYAFRLRLLGALRNVVEITVASVASVTDACVSGRPVSTSSNATFFLGQTGTASVTTYLPDAFQFPNLTYFFKNDGPNPFQICGSNGQTIDGSACITLPNQNQTAGVTSDGTNWVVLFSPDTGAGQPVLTSSLGASFDNGVASIPAGKVGDIWVPFDCTITGVTVLASRFTSGSSGSIQLDVWRTPYGSFPPGVGGSITGGNYPTISSGNKYQDLTLSGWTTAVAADDTLRFYVNTCSGITQAVVILRIEK